MHVVNFLYRCRDTVKKESSAKARCFLKLLKDKHAIEWIRMLLDVISCLSAVSTMIQTKHVT